jgi:chromosome partitioning related protein ParA
MIKFATISTKGGVGKTTLTADLAGLVADMGLRVLMIDADIQPSLSKYYRLKHRAPLGLTHVIMKQNVNDDCISRTEIENLDIILSDDSEGILQPWLMSRVDGAERLANALRSPLITDDHYDCIFIDTQGSVGPLQNNAALASSQILLPVLPETLAARELTSGTLDMLERLEPSPTFRNRAGPIRAIIYRQDRTSDSKLVAEELKRDFLKLEGRVTLLNTAVPSAKSYKEAATLGIPVHRHEPHHRTMSSAYDVMHNLVWELIPSLKGIHAGGYTNIAISDAHPQEVAK